MLVSNFVVHLNRIISPLLVSIQYQILKIYRNLVLDSAPLASGMSTYPASPARQTVHSALYKMPSPTVRSDETWKDRYRLHCKQQFKRARDKVVNKMRQLSVRQISRSITHVVHSS